MNPLVFTPSIKMEEIWNKRIKTIKSSSIGNYLVSAYGNEYPKNIFSISPNSLVSF